MDNREHLDKLVETFEEWLHIEDKSLLYTLCATKYSHQMSGDPIWLMVIGPSSGGKSEILRAYTQEDEIKIDDLTQNTFVSGFKSAATDELPQFAESLAHKIWYIYDLSILMSKDPKERSSILSDMRMIYDGHIKKQYGNKISADVKCPNNTLICGTTNAIDNTILEDQLLGTRFITYRMQKANRKAIMDIIDKNQDKMVIMRENLNRCVREFEKLISVKEWETTETDNHNIQLMSNTATLLRTAVATDRSGEPINLAYPEEPGRVYKQLKKLYMAYRIVGLNEEEAIRCLRKICIDNINPLRIKLLNYMYLNNCKDDRGNRPDFTTTQLHKKTGIGKKAVKQHMHSMNMLELVDYDCVEDEQYGRIIRDEWTLREMNLAILFGDKVNIGYGKSLYPLFRRCKVGG